jgi:membrane-associated phospholipid phosphatase
MTRLIYPFLLMIGLSAFFSPALLFGSEAMLEQPDRSERSDPPEEKIGEETLFSLEYGSRLVQDTRHLLSAPARWGKKEWRAVSIGAAGVGAVLLLDRSIRDAVSQNRNETTDAIAHRFEAFGTVYSFAVLGGFYLGGTLFENPKAKATALDGLSASFITSVVVVPAIKVVVGRSRPSEDEGRFRFRPFSGRSSFPSGHAAQAFTVASVVAAHYESIWIRGTAYGLATLAGLARIDRGRHYASDVAAGALIGASIGTAVVHLHEKEKGRVVLSPIIDRERGGILLTFRF